MAESLIAATSGPMVKARMIRMTVPSRPALPIAPTIAFLHISLDSGLDDDVDDDDLRDGKSGITRFFRD
jgi:hypothetical protein